MEMVVSALQILIGIGSLVCFVMVVMKMFQNQQTGLGIASIALLIVCGIGALIAFIYGWINAQKWGIQNVMYAWTGCVVAGIVLGLIANAMAPAVQ